MGSVYFIQAEHGGPIKIGYTAGAPGQRLLELQSGNPYTLVIRKVVPGDRVFEQGLHLLFAGDRLRGEWFRPSPTICALIGEGRPGEDRVLGQWRRELADALAERYPVLARAIEECCELVREGDPNAARLAFRLTWPPGAVVSEEAAGTVFVAGVIAPNELLVRRTWNGPGPLEVRGEEAA